MRMSDQLAARWVRVVQFGSSAYIGGDHSEPSPAQVHAWQRRMGPPDNELPGAMPFHAVLHRHVDQDRDQVSAIGRIPTRVRRGPIQPGRRHLPCGRCLPRWSDRQHREQPTSSRFGYARGRAFAHGSRRRRRGWARLRDELLANTRAPARRPDDHRRLANSGHTRIAHGDSERRHCPGCLSQCRTLAVAATRQRRTPAATEASSARGRLVRPARDRRSVRRLTPRHQHPDGDYRPHSHGRRSGALVGPRVRECVLATSAAVRRLPSRISRYGTGTGGHR